MTETDISAGAWNERGMIQDLDKRGFSYNNCLSELISNSLEEKVNATKSIIRVTNKYIYITDDGNGMNKEELVNMLEIFRSNNSNNKSMGVSGLGFKAATKILSNNTTVTVYTRNKGKWLKMILPWDTIVSENIYTDAAKISSDLKQEDHDELLKLDIGSGTTIKIKYNIEFYDAIKNNFGDSRKRLPIKERLDFIFGHKPHEIQLIDDNDLDNNTTIRQGYDYFNAESIYFYKGKYQDRIMQYKDQTGNIFNIYVDEDDDETKYYETRKTKKKNNELTEVSKTKKNYIVNGRWKPVSEINVLNGMRKDKNIVNEQSSTDFVGNEATEYDLRFFEYGSRIDIVKKELAETMLYRNNQFIGKIPLEKYKSTSARASNQLHNKIINFRTEVHYETLSTQDNEIDKVLCIQSNKNQLNSDEISQEIKDILTHIKDKRWDSINLYFKECFYKNSQKFSSSKPTVSKNGTNTKTTSPNTLPTEPEPPAALQIPEAKQPTRNTPPTKTEPEPPEALQIPEAKQPIQNTPSTKTDPEPPEALHIPETKQPTQNTPPTKTDPEPPVIPEPEQPDKNTPLVVGTRDVCTEQLEPELPDVSVSNQTGKDFRQIVEQKICTKIDNNKSYKKQDIENFINEVENLYDKFFNQM